MEVAVRARRAEILGGTLRKFLRRGATTHVSKLLGHERPQEVALALRDLTPAYQADVCRILLERHPDNLGEVLIEMEPQHRRGLLERMTSEQLADVLEVVPVDDGVFLVEDLPTELKDEVLSIVDRRSELSGLQQHLTYGEDSAGRIMDPEFFALRQSTLIHEAIATVQKGRDVEMIFYVYVVDEEGCLVGVTSLRQLLLSDPETTLGEIMQRDVISVTTDTDQEEVAQLVSRYDLLAIPVVDHERRLVGVVTVDDIIDIVKEEATEDILKMVGTSDNELLYQDQSLKVVRIRLPWLLFNLVGGILAGLLLANFQTSMVEALFLLIFHPLVLGMSGNVGSQTATITVRGLASGRLAKGRVKRYLWQQARVGFLLGSFFALIGMAGAFLIERNPVFSMVVGVALFVAICLASVNGVLIPVLFDRLGIDPAIVSGPLVTTGNDVLGTLIYFGLASALYGFLMA